MSALNYFCKNVCIWVLFLFSNSIFAGVTQNDIYGDVDPEVYSTANPSSSDFHLIFGGAIFFGLIFLLLYSRDGRKFLFLYASFLAGVLLLASVLPKEIFVWVIVILSVVLYITTERDVGQKKHEDKERVAPDGGRPQDKNLSRLGSNVNKNASAADVSGKAEASLVEVGEKNGGMKNNLVNFSDEVFCSEGSAPAVGTRASSKGLRKIDCQAGDCVVKKWDYKNKALWSLENGAVIDVRYLKPSFGIEQEKNGVKVDCGFVSISWIDANEIRGMDQLISDAVNSRAG